MESDELNLLLEQLDDEIDELEDSLAPVLKSALSATASKLPLLDKAKLYVLVTYAIESMLFSYLRLNGVNAREHPVFKELTRVKQYFEKVKGAEEPSSERPVVSLDKKAAMRFIKAGLTGNNEYDSKRTQRQEVEMIPSRTKFEDLSNSAENTKISHSVATDESDSSPLDVDTARRGSPTAVHASKKRKADVIDDSLPASSLLHMGSDLELPRSRGKKSEEGKRRRKKNKKKAKGEDKEHIENQVGFISGTMSL